MSNLQVGHKVVRIGSGQWRSKGDYVPPNLPQPDVVYTVRAVVIADDGNVGIMLDEVRNEPRPGYEEPSFMARRFRRVVERKTDISIFQAMLTPKPIHVDAL